MGRNIIIAISLLYYFNFYPFYITAWLIKPSYIVSVLLAILWYVFLNANNRLIHKPSDAFNKCTTLILLYYLFRLLVFEEASSISSIVDTFFGWIGVYFTINTYNFEQIYTFGKRFLYIMLCCSLIGVVLYVIGVLPVVATHIYSEDTAYGSRFINNYLLFNAKFGDFSDIIFVRTAGWFDEPGSFAYVMALFLILNTVTKKSRKVKIILQYLGCITLSAAHFVVVTCFLLFDKFKFINVLVAIFIGCILYGLYFLIPQDGVGGFIRHATFDRALNIYEGTDRSRDYESAKIAADETCVFGESIDIISKRHPDATADTFYFYIAQYGVFGILFTYLYILVGLYKRKNDENVILLIVVFCALLYQRPIINFPLYTLLLYYIFFQRTDFRQNNYKI